MGDIDEIKQVKYRYLRALDTKNWDEFADTLTEDVTGDYGQSIGRGTPFHRPRRAGGVHADVAADRRSSPSTASPTPRSSLDGDEASATWYLQDRVIVPDFNFMLIGAAFYHDRYRRTSDGWKISATGYDRTYDATMSLEGLNFKLKPGRALNI